MANKLIQDLGAGAFALTDLLEHQPIAGPPSLKGDVAALVTLLNTIYAPITGGAYVLKAGDTMTGPLLASPDNTVDLGASGATRFRTGYFGTSAVTALLASPAATALSFASAGTTRANFSTTGHLLFNTDNTNDIGASGATRPRNIFAGSTITGVTVVGANAVQTSGQFQVAAAGGKIWFLGDGGSGIKSTADGIIQLCVSAENDFNRLILGGTTNAFPSIKRSGVIAQARLADDSAFATYQGIIQIAVAATAAAPPVTTHTIPITDSTGQVYRVPCLV